MRALFALVAGIGIAGIVLGILTLLRGPLPPNSVPFRFEGYGGPGPILGGVLMVIIGLYLRSVWSEKG